MVLSARNDFDARTNEAKELVNEDDNEFSGDVDIFNPNAGGAANIVDDGGEASVTVAISGAITDEDGEQTVITGGGSGVFGGPDAEQVFIGTQVTASGGIGESLDGFIIAERD